MIPLRLNVKNFLCYGEGLDSLDLEGVRVACLCGDNGHGKSALLDAMTWALWGQARASRQEELIHQGRTEMQVDLEFLAGDQRYRVIRKHSRGGRGRQGVTDLQLLAASDGGFRSITENSVRQTEEKIRRLLRMDYTTFTNTAFLLQGRADKFTTSPPMERKRLLADVLSLDGFEQAAERAREQARGMEQEERRLQGEIEAWAQQLQLLPDYQRELEQAQTEMEGLAPLVEEWRQGMMVLEERVQRLHNQQEELGRVQGAVARALQEQRQLQEQASAHEDRLGRLTALAERQGEIEERYAQWQRLRDEEAVMERTRIEVEALAEQRRALERTVEQQVERLVNQALHLRERLEDELRPKAESRSTLERELKVAHSGEAVLDQQDALLREQRQKLEEAGSRAQEVATRQQLLQDELHQLKARAALFSQADARCPLCKTPLGPENRHHLEEELHLQEVQVHSRRLTYQQELRTLEEERQGLRRDVGQREQELDQGRRHHQATLAGLDRELAEAHRATEEADRLGQELLSLEERLAKGAPMQSGEQGQLRQVAAKLVDLGYDSAHHQEVRQQASALVEYQGLHLQLQDAIATLEEERRALETTRQMAQRHAAEAGEAQERQAVLEEALRGLPQQEEVLAEAKASWEVLEEQRQSLEGTITRRQWDLERLEGLARQKAEREGSLLGLQQRRAIYQELSEAFGKNGIQAYLIDDALPELEREANDLLHRLTDNRLSIKLETQRQRRTTKGEPIETLDIYIGDELTPARSYELFSGGEAFRVNVALRIALSKLLAHRAGAPLPTLFIDEGFGTQDATGRERLVEVINTIQDDFERIIVVTHIEELKELFPVRIEVQKTGAGSTFWMS